MPLSPEHVLLSGVNFHGTLRALERAHGPETQRRVTARLPGDVGLALRSCEIVSSGWYLASWYGALLSAICDELGADESCVRALAREAVRHDFATLFRVLSLVVSPERIVANAVKVVARYLKGGTISALEAKPGRAHLRFAGFAGYDRRMWADFVGGMEGVLIAMRVPGATTEIVKGGKDGDDACEVVLRW